MSSFQALLVSKVDQQSTWIPYHTDRADKSLDSFALTVTLTMVAPGYGGPGWLWDCGYGGLWLWRPLVMAALGYGGPSPIRVGDE